MTTASNEKNKLSLYGSLNTLDTKRQKTHLSSFAFCYMLLLLLFCLALWLVATYYVEAVLTESKHRE